MIEEEEAVIIAQEMMQGMVGNVHAAVHRGGSLDNALQELDLGFVMGVMYKVGHPDSWCVKVDLLPRLMDRMYVPDGTFRGLHIRIIWAHDEPLVAYCLGHERIDSNLGPDFEVHLTAACRDVMLEHDVPVEVLDDIMGDDRWAGRRNHPSMSAKIQAQIDQEVAAFRESINSELDDIFGGGET